MTESLIPEIHKGSLS